MRALHDQRDDGVSRRRFLANTSALGAAASLFGVPRIAASEPPPETRKIRVLHSPGICLVPQYLAEDLLHLEGFDEVEYVKDQYDSGFKDVAADKADVTINDAPGALPVLDAGMPVVLVGGIHAGCYELFGTRQIQGIRDLKGKTVAVYALGLGSHIIVASMLAYVGMNPNDVHWVAGADNAMRLFVEGKADAFIGFPRAHRSYERKRSVMSFSIHHETGLGRSTSVACWAQTAASLRTTRSRQSERCEPSLRQPTSALSIPPELRATWSRRAMKLATKLRTKYSRRSPIVDGARRTQRIPSASMLCACTKLEC